MMGKYRIFNITPEVAPFVGSSANANISGTLPKVLKNLGHDIRVMMPKYGSVNERKYVLRDVIRLREMEIEIAGKKISVDAKSAFLPDSKVQVYFLDHPSFSERNGIYSENGNKEYEDNIERFVLFSRGCLKTLRSLHWQPDFILCNCWPSIFLPLILRNELQNDDFFANTKLIFCDHNNSSSAKLELEDLTNVGLTTDEIQGKLTNEKMFDVHELASVTSDAIIYSLKQENLNGTQDFEKFIAHGIDYQDWNPETDEKINEKFSIDSFHLKSENKKTVCEDFDLEYDEHVPLVSVHFDDDEQGEFVPELVEKLKGINAQFIFLVDDAVQNVTDDKKELSDTIRVKVDPSPKVKHQVIAGSDFNIQLNGESGIVESRFLQYLKYGTLGIFPESCIQSFKPEAIEILDELPFYGKLKGDLIESLVGELERFVSAFKDQSKWQQKAQKSMQVDFSLLKTGEQYTALFDTLSQK